MSHIHHIGGYSVQLQEYLERARAARAARRDRPAGETLSFDSAIDPDRDADSKGHEEKEAPQEDGPDDDPHHLNAQA